MDLTDNTVIEFMRSRRSVPAKLMTGPGPDADQLRSIVEIAARVPDHGKLVPWRFIQYGEKKCADLGNKILARSLELAQQQGRELNEEAKEIERARFLRTPVVIGVVCCARDHVKIPEWEQILSSGAAAMNMLIAANACGFDAQWLTEWYAYDDTLRHDLGLSEGERIVGFIHIGTRVSPKTSRDRPTLDDVFSLLDQ